MYHLIKLGCLLLVLFFTSSALVQANDVQIWTFTSKTTKGTCSTKPTTLQVKNNRISGTIVSNLAGKVSVSGRVRADGTFSGTMARGLARFSGTFEGNTGTGTWRDVTGCRGTMAVRRVK